MSAADTLYALAFSPDGSHLVGATSRGLLLIWKLASSAATGASTTALALAPPTLAAKLQAHTSTIYSLAFAPGDMLITGSDEEMRGWRWSQLLAGTVAPLFDRPFAEKDPTAAAAFLAGLEGEADIPTLTGYVFNTFDCGSR